MIQKIKYIGVLIFFGFLSPSSIAQFGVRAHYGSSSFSDFQTSIRLGSKNPNYSLFSKSIDIGVDYWVRMKDYRVEFYPEFSFGLSSDAEVIINSDPSKLGYSHFDFNVNTHIYFLDFMGDCDCPTFSKQGELFKKGFFVLFAPGIGLSNQSYSSTFTTSQNKFFPKFAAGVGLDIGINDLITISPILRVSYIPSIGWDAFGDLIAVPGANEKSQIWYYQFGLRLGFRPDYKKRP